MREEKEKCECRAFTAVGRHEEIAVAAHLRTSPATVSALKDLEIRGMFGSTERTERSVATGAGGERRRGAEQSAREDEGAATSCAGVAQDGI